MGNCLSCVDVSTRYQNTGMVQRGMDKANSAEVEATNAVALLTGSAAYSSWVEIRIACQHLKAGDALSKSDPMAVLFELQPYTGARKELGRTEVIAETISPTFAVALKVLYNFERMQPLQLVVVDIDKGQDPRTIDPARCDFLGELSFTLSELLTNQGKTMTRPLNTRSSHKSMAVLRAEELASSKEVITMQLAGVGLRNMELLSKSDPFLEISRMNQGDDAAHSSWQPVYRTEARDNNLNPVWLPITIRASQLCNGDVYRPLLLKVFDYNTGGAHKLIGQVETSASHLEAAARSGTNLQLTLPNKPKDARGALQIKSYQVEVRPTFLDYIQAGTELSFIVAVDFTASNKPPTDPTSLHYLNPSDPTAPTKYEQALMGVARVLEYYDTDRMYPAWGFGGVFGTYPVSHCFPLNGAEGGVCAGVEGVRQAYRQALSAWRLSGPTLFAPTIRTACSVATQPSPGLRYSVLLILTDGEIMDMPETIDAIVAASSLPLSILVVGIGDASFANMERLDGDKVRLVSSSGHPAERDIVQFVEFRKYQNDADALAAELLAELPGQFLAYTRSRSIPLPAANPNGPPATPA